MKPTRNWLTIVLVLLNLLLMGFILFNRLNGPPPPRPADMPRMWQKALDLSDTQRDAFAQITAEHRKNTEPLMQAQMENRQALLRAAGAEQLDTMALNRLADESGRLHRELDAGLDRQFKMRVRKDVVIEE